MCPPRSHDCQRVLRARLLTGAAYAAVRMNTVRTRLDLPLRSIRNVTRHSPTRVARTAAPSVGVSTLRQLRGWLTLISTRRRVSGLALTLRPRLSELAISDAGRRTPAARPSRTRPACEPRRSSTTPGLGIDRGNTGACGALGASTTAGGALGASTTVACFSTGSSTMTAGALTTGAGAIGTLTAGVDVPGWGAA